MSIRLLMPTRGRPKQAREAIYSVINTASHKIPIEIIVCVDDDDVPPFVIGIGESLPSCVKQICKARKTFIEWCNEVWNVEGDFKWLAWLADDVRYLSKDWDQILYEHNELLVYGPDGYQNERLCTHPFFNPIIPRSLGYLLPSQFHHLYADVFIGEIAKALNSYCYDPRIVIEHLHPAAGKAKMDATYEDEVRKSGHDNRVWNEEISKTIPALAEQIRKKL